MWTSCWMLIPLYLHFLQEHQNVLLVFLSLLSMLTSFWAWHKCQNCRTDERSWYLKFDRTFAALLFFALVWNQNTFFFAPLTFFSFILSLTIHTLKVSEVVKVCIHCTFRYIGFWWMMDITSYITLNYFALLTCLFIMQCVLTYNL